MDKKKKTPEKTNPLFIISGVLFMLFCLDILFVMLFRTVMNSYKQTQNEMTILDQDKRIITASADISEKYKNEIQAISAVFPSEKNFPVFIQSLETILKTNVDEYQIKFSPDLMTEGDKLFLLMTISIKTDLPKFLVFLHELEKMPYMTHITGISAKTPTGMIGGSEYSLGLKVYVQNPFK